MYRTRIFGSDGGDRTSYKLQNSEQPRMSHVTGANKSRKKRETGDARRKREICT